MRYGCRIPFGVPTEVNFTSTSLCRSKIDNFGKKEICILLSHHHSIHGQTWSPKELTGHFFYTRQYLQQDKLHGLSWFMQDGARPHCMPTIFDFLQEYLDDRVIVLHFRNHVENFNRLASNVWLLNICVNTRKSCCTSKIHKLLQTWKTTSVILMTPFILEHCHAYVKIILCKYAIVLLQKWLYWEHYYLVCSIANSIYWCVILNNWIFLFISF